MLRLFKSAGYRAFWVAGCSNGDGKQPADLEPRGRNSRHALTGADAQLCDYLFLPRRASAFATLDRPETGTLALQSLLKDQANMSLLFINNTLETFTPTKSGALATIIWECCRVAERQGRMPAVVTRACSISPFPWPRDDIRRSARRRCRPASSASCSCGPTAR